MKKIFHFTILVLSFVVLSSGECNGDKGSKNEIASLLPGYTFYDAPNDLDKTGLIFRVTPEGQRYDVGYLDVTPGQGRIEIKSTQQERNMTINALANFLKIDKTKLSADANMDLNNKVSFRIKLIDNVQESLTDFAIDEKLKDALELIKKNRRDSGRLNDKYYLIRESVLTKNIEYGFEKNVADNAGFKLAVGDLLNVGSDIKWDAKKEFQLGFTYDKPLRVFYKAEYLSITSSAAGGIDIKRKPVTNEEIYTDFTR
jgi:hypothetical protein